MKWDVNGISVCMAKWWCEANNVMKLKEKAHLESSSILSINWFHLLADKVPWFKIPCFSELLHFYKSISMLLPSLLLLYSCLQVRFHVLGSRHDYRHTFPGKCLSKKHGRSKHNTLLASIPTRWTINRTDVCNSKLITQVLFSGLLWFVLAYKSMNLLSCNTHAAAHTVWSAGAGTFQHLEKNQEKCMRERKTVDE